MDDIYYIIGTAYAGKSTMVKMLAEKYDGIACEENYHERLVDEKLDKDEFPALCYTRDLQDWRKFIRRTPEEYAAWIESVAKECEVLELRILDNLKKEGRKIFVDTNISIETLKRISDTDHVLVMLSDQMVSVNRFFERPDREKQFLYQLLMQEPDPEAAMANFKEMLTRVNSKEVYDRFLHSGFRVLIRDDSRSVEETFELVRKMLKLQTDLYRPGFHLTPPCGWMNDPNGLCQFRGEYHVFFQYTPEGASGDGERCWGHYAGKDLFDLSFRGIVFHPDSEKDRNGAFSGSALVIDDELLIYYTGNVEWEGDYDHTYSGREANTILISSEDGEHFGKKLLLMSNADYPAEYTCHIRDPKVWQTNGTLRMVQGGRLDGRNTPDGDKGAVLVFEKSEKSPWQTIGSITTRRPFGYMWECPDYFELGGRKVLSCCPQGLPSENSRWQNVYQSGYFRLPENFDIAKAGGEQYIEDPEENFTEWDMGFDFYAPQTFADESGRRILIGWAGIGDADYDNVPTIKSGWQHALTLPRELSLSEETGMLRQWPVEELAQLRTGHRTVSEGGRTKLHLRRADVYAETVEDELRQDPLAYSGPKKVAEMLLMLNDPAGELLLLTLSRAEEKVALTLFLTEAAGRGRKQRKVLLKELRNLRIVIDESLAEIYLNDGETVMTTRFYASEEYASEPYILSLGELRAEVWDMKSAYKNSFR